MAYKTFALNERIAVTIYKRRANRSLRLSITSDNKVRVSIPAWAPYRAGLEFARSRLTWIEQQLKPTLVLQEGQVIGKAHRLHFNSGGQMERPRSRRKGGAVVVTYPTGMSVNSAEVQAVAQRAAVAALRFQAEQLLPQRLAQLAQQHNFTYKSITIKQLRGRWGSCDHQHNIVLNLYLMQVPWELIDYVLLHELVHTKVLRHGPEFWEQFEHVLPDAKQRRKQIHEHQPILRGSSLANVT